MAVRRRIPASNGADGRSIPKALLRAPEPLWTDPEESRQWFAAHGITSGLWFRHGPAGRRREAIEGWARVHGLVTGRESHPDLTAIRAAGVEVWAQPAFRERLHSISAVFRH